jgi:hypothetical protein
LPGVDAEVFVFLGAVADTEGVPDAPFADDVQHADLFGQTDEVPQRNGHGGQKDRKSLGAGGDRRCEDERRRQMAVLRGVVFRKYRDERAARLGPRTHVDRRAVKLGRRSASGRRAHVEPERDHPAPGLYAGTDVWSI